MLSLKKGSYSILQKYYVEPSVKVVHYFSIIHY